MPTSSTAKRKIAVQGNVRLKPISSPQKHDDCSSSPRSTRESQSVSLGTSQKSNPDAQGDAGCFINPAVRLTINSVSYKKTPIKTKEATQKSTGSRETCEPAETSCKDLIKSNIVDYGCYSTKTKMTNPKEKMATVAARPASTDSSSANYSKASKTSKTTARNEKRSPKSRRPREQLRIVDAAPLRFVGDLVPMNAGEQKEKFLKFGITPQFELKGAPESVERICKHQIGHIRFNFFNEARRILDSAVKKYRYLDSFIESNYGTRLTLEEATQKVLDYIAAHKLESSMDVIFCGNLACSAQMSSTGMEPRANRPDLRHYTLLVKSASDNTFLREKGIVCLMDHEIGTHYFRSYNDGFQPWYSCRNKYGLAGVKSYEGLKTEEGLACVHTLLNSTHKLLTMPALLYYASCMAEYLTFKQLFDHLGKYVKNEEQRWKHCMRVKRGVKNVNDPGGYGKDQRYFEGAVEILRRLDEIDFTLLMSGKITLEELPRVKRLARLGSIRLPNFMADIETYKKLLKHIAKVNGLLKPAPKTVALTREDMLQRLQKMDICSELPHFPGGAGGSCCGDPGPGGSGAGCGCLLFTRSKRKLLSRESRDPDRLREQATTPNSASAKQPVPILLEVETCLPLLGQSSGDCVASTGC